MKRKLSKSFSSTRKILLIWGRSFCSHRITYFGIDSFTSSPIDVMVQVLWGFLMGKKCVLLSSRTQKKQQEIIMWTRERKHDTETIVQTLIYAEVSSRLIHIPDQFINGDLGSKLQLETIMFITGLFSQQISIGNLTCSRCLKGFKTWNQSIKHKQYLLVHLNCISLKNLIHIIQLRFLEGVEYHIKWISRVCINECSEGCS